MDALLAMAHPVAGALMVGVLGVARHTEFTLPIKIPVEVLAGLE